jgi:hypothetical protein
LVTLPSTADGVVLGIGRNELQRAREVETRSQEGAQDAIIRLISGGNLID